MKTYAKTPRRARRRCCSKTRKRVVFVAGGLAVSTLLVFCKCPAFLPNAGQLLWDVRGAAVEFTLTVAAVCLERRTEPKGHGTSHPGRALTPAAGP